MMKIWRYLKAENIYLNESLASKEAVFRFVADASVGMGLVKNAERVYEGMKAREETMTTGAGGGLGFPHTTCGEAADAAVFLIRPAQPLEYEAIDHLPVDIILALVIPENNTPLHLQILAGVSRLCKEPAFLRAVRQAADSKMLWNEIKTIEENMAFH